MINLLSELPQGQKLYFCKEGVTLAKLSNTLGQLQVFHIATPNHLFVLKDVSLKEPEDVGDHVVIRSRFNFILAFGIQMSLVFTFVICNKVKNTPYSLCYFLFIILSQKKMWSFVAIGKDRLRDSLICSTEWNIYGQISWIHTGCIKQETSFFLMN